MSKDYKYHQNSFQNVNPFYSHKVFLPNLHTIQLIQYLVSFALKKHNTKIKLGTSKQITIETITFKMFEFKRNSITHEHIYVHNIEIINTTINGK